jgi:PAS domain S-box-containing protein
MECSDSRNRIIELCQKIKKLQISSSSKDRQDLLSKALDDLQTCLGESGEEDGLHQKKSAASQKLAEAEEALKEKNEEQALLLDNIETQIWYLTDIKTYGAVNRAHAVFLGINEENLEGKSLYNVLSEQEADVCVAGNVEVFEKKRQIHTEEWIKNGKGELRLLSITKSPKLNEKGVVKYVVCAAEDITESKQAVEKLQKTMDYLELRVQERTAELVNANEALCANLQFLETLIDTIPSPIFYKDRKGIYRGCNKKFAEQILGLSRDEIVGRSLSDLPGAIPCDLADVYRDQDRELIREGGIQVYESEVQCADGKRRDFRFSKAAFTDAADNVAGLIGVMVDVTDHRRIEETLRQSEEKYRELVENVNDTIYALNERGTLTYISPTVGLLGGYFPSELVGLNFSDLVYEEDLPAVRESVQRSLSGKVESIEFRVLTKSGEILWLQASGRPFFADGHIAGLQGVLTNITKRKIAEVALKESEERFKAQYRGNPTPTFTWQKQGSDFVLVDLNEAAKAITGGKVSKFVGRKASDMYANRQDILQDLLRIHEERCVIRREICSQNFVPNAHVVVTFASVPPDLVLVYLEDITERKRAEEALRKSEQEKAAILSGLKKVALEYLDPEMRIIWVNNAVQKFIGLSEEEIRGKHCFKLLHGVDEPCQGCTAFLALKTGQSQEGELTTPDGKIWISRSSPLKDENGAVIGVVHAAVNITENRRVQEELQLERNKLKEILNAIEDGVCTTNQRYEVEYINPATERSLGL